MKEEILKQLIELQKSLKPTDKKLIELVGYIVAFSNEDDLKLAEHMTANQ